MCNTRGAAAVAALRQIECLFPHSVTVCTVVCERFMTCVPHEGHPFVLSASSGPSAELWRFSTSTRVWELAHSTASNGARPSARRSHVMTSVGLDLWVHGGWTGSGEGVACATHVALLLLPR
jgi:hypothetical protein